MNKRTHVLGGIAVASGYLVATGLSHGRLPPLQSQYAAAGLAMLGSMFPDIDLPTSWIGRRAKGISSIVGTLFGHRGMFHSPLFYAVLLALGCWRWPTWGWYFGAFGVGVLVHLVLDSLNAKGVPWLWPVRKRLCIAHIKNGSLGETVTTIVTLLLALFMLLWYAFLTGLLFLGRG